MPLNTYGLTKKIVYENEEFSLLQSALNIEESIEDLRYNNVVVATDADVDGMHIRLLLLTFFLQFFPDLVKALRSHTTKPFEVHLMDDSRAIRAVDRNKILGKILLCPMGRGGRDRLDGDVKAQFFR